MKQMDQVVLRQMMTTFCFRTKKRTGIVSAKMTFTTQIIRKFPARIPLQAMPTPSDEDTLSQSAAVSSKRIWRAFRYC